MRSSRRTFSFLWGIIGLIAFASGGCATNALNREWKSERGYSDADIQRIQAEKADYYLAYQAARQESSSQNTLPISRVEDRFVKVFCACYKKLGDRCRQKPAGLSGGDLSLWAKANAVDWVLLTEHNPFTLKPERKIESAECQ